MDGVGRLVAAVNIVVDGVLVMSGDDDEGGGGGGGGWLMDVNSARALRLQHVGFI